MNSISLFNSEGALNLIVKTAGTLCNLNCKYCFELPKDAARAFISVQTLKNVIENTATTAAVVFHGGEPLIVGVEHFRTLLELIRDYYPQKITAVRIQTNATLLNQEWIDLLFKEYADLKIEIAVSLDGTEVMNVLRVDSNARPTFARIMSSIQLLAENNIKTGILSVISKPSLQYAKEYISFISSIPNVSFVKINALFNVENNALTADSITPSEYAQFIMETANEYINSGLYKRLPIEPLLSILQKLKGKRSRYCNYSCRKCFNYICVYPDGVIAPCDCLSLNEYSIPQSKAVPVNENIAEYVKSDSCSELRGLISKCDGCDILDFCSGGCLSQRLYFKDNEFLSSDFCKSKHMLYEYFAQLLVKGGKTDDKPCRS